MLIIVIKVNAAPGQAQGIKEDLAMYLERFGDCKVVEIREDVPVQMSLEGALRMPLGNGKYEPRGGGERS